ncbi:hypothetical protein PV10_08409 [Exophiala mesophila]|uniref:Nicotinamide-nucleotide adenylyltransferase n=1 Tax=Exophiala mesophila TaxID=212818 RepID=A0A0D1Z4B4_EXOME|nr:uncharacterized protein PV10_08409 [Exophiala mesophila]KIV88764.1 hypothetical protein PV10_08409 [Exophiala mesophila]
MSPTVDMQALQRLRTRFSQALKEFADSPASFQILHTIPPSHPPSSAIPINTLYVLDSSFNPPSKAHLSLVKATLKQSQLNTKHDPISHVKSSHGDGVATDGGPPRVLFLLATVNADKKPKPADFEDRLVMMTLMAEELRSLQQALAKSSTDVSSESRAPIVDIGITKQPYFIDKAKSIEESHAYSSTSTSTTAGAEDTPITQVHITGFDTLTRIFAPKYYPEYTPPLSALEPFLSRHRIHATIRVESTSTNDNDVQDEFGTIDSQRAYLDGLARGDLEEQGLKREWAGQVDLVVDESGDAQGVSSTKARACVKEGRTDDLSHYVGDGVRTWIVERGLYT